MREAVTERWLDELILGPLTEIAAAAAAGNALEQLRKYIAKLIELKHHYAEQDSEMFKMYASVTEEASELIDTHIQRIISQMGSVIDKGVQEGTITPISRYGDDCPFTFLRDGPVPPSLPCL